MIRLLVTLVVSLLACTSGQTQSTRDQIHLRATVQNYVPLTEFSGEITQVDFDPKFALTVRIESVDPAVGGFTVGAIVAFAIHSPALLFGGDATKGKTYNFSLQREIKHGKTRFFGLKVEKVQTAPAVSVPYRRCEVILHVDDYGVYQDFDSSATIAK
jgi:hypothetical protein